MGMSESRDPEDTSLPPLTLSEADMREVGDFVLGRIYRHFSTLRDLPVTLPAELHDLTAALREPPPETGAGISELLAQLDTHVFGNMTHLDHPRNFAFVPGPSNFISAMADAIAASLNVFSGGFLGPSGVAQIEITTIEWLRQLFRFPAEAGGLFVSGGSMANLTGLAVARHAMLGDNTANATVYFSDQTHSSVAKGLRILGFQQFQLRKLASDENFRLDLGALAAKIAADRAQGMVPFAIVANAGTTNTGAVDPIAALADFAKAEGLWLHVDGAYGGSAALTELGRSATGPLERADSLSIDPHKWMFQPYEIGCVLVKDRALLKDTFKFSAEYLKILDHSAEQMNFSDYGVQLTRSFRALKLWMSFKAFGVDAFRRAIDIGIRNAEYVQSLLTGKAHWQIVTPAQLGIITFRFVAPGLDDERLDAINNAIARAVIYSGQALLSPTILAGRHVLRLCTINPRTTPEDLRSTIAWLETCGNSEAGSAAQ
jgi:aromatic-L-amino-acid/L-tryptophan decarboxylase